MLELLKDKDDKPKSMIEAIREVYGFKNVAYLGLNLPNKLTENGPLVLTTYSLEWIEHYKDRNFVDFDPVLYQSLKSILPSDWQEFNQSEKRVRDLFNEARLFGIGRQGLSLPIRGPRGELALFSITSDDDLKNWLILKNECMGELQILANHLHTQITGVDNSSIRHFDQVPRLSKREIEVLTWAAAGKTVADIAIILSISAHTVRTYLEMSRARLNAINTTHAVARALSLDLIRLRH